MREEYQELLPDKGGNSGEGSLGEDEVKLPLLLPPRQEESEDEGTNRALYQ